MCIGLTRLGRDVGALALREDGGHLIDLHSHILPGIDDGADSLEASMDMARLCLEDGVTTIACTPHILPGVYANTGPAILDAVRSLQLALTLRGLALTLVAGADNHIVPTFAKGLRDGALLTLAGSRYVLVEPPHKILIPRLEEFFFDLQANGYVPILTHPERLAWIEENYDIFRRLAAKGVWMQLTAQSVTGKMGRRPLYWSERMLDEGIVQIIASDAHDTVRRPPGLSAAAATIARRVGDAEAVHMVKTRPAGVLSDAAPQSLPPVRGVGISGAGA